MRTKFILINAQGQPQVMFGNRYFEDDYHANIAERLGIPRSKVLGGGIADHAAKRIYGTSYGFGPYDVAVVRQALPDWTVETPSAY